MKSVFSPATSVIASRAAMYYWRQPTAVNVIPPSRPKFRFTKLVDTQSNIPGGRGYFQGFGRGQVAIQKGQVAFFGTGHGGQSGIYLSDPKGLRVIASSDNTLPDSANRFACFGSCPVFDQGHILFLGQEQTARLRIYRDTPYRLNAIVSSDIPVLESGDSFINFSNPVACNGTAAFMGRVASGHQKGIFKVLEDSCHDPIVQKIVLVGEGNSPLMDVSIPAIDGAGNLAFRGQDSQYQVGLYWHHRQTLRAMATTETPIPNGIGCFTRFSDPLLDRGQIIFCGTGSVGQQGIYRISHKGLETIVDSQTRMPESLETFADFVSFSVEGDQVAFVSRDNYGRLSLFLATDGVLLKVIEIGDRLDDKTVVGLSLGRFGLSDQAMTFRTQFVDGTEGIFRAAFQGSMVSNR